MRIKNHGITYIIILVLIVALMTSGCGSKTSVDAEPEKTVPVKVGLSQTEDLPEFQSFPGKVMAVD